MKEDTGNRVEKHLQNWSGKNPKPSFDSPSYADKRLGYFEKMKKEMDTWPNLSTEEKKSLKTVNKESGKMQRTLHPGFLERLLGKMNNPVTRFLAHFLKGIREAQNVHRDWETSPSRTGNPVRQAPGKNIDKMVPKKESFKMNDTLQHLKRNMEEQGFSGSLDRKIIDAIRSRDPSFIVSRDIGFGKDQMKYSVNYERSSASGRYYPGQIEARLRKDLPVTFEGAGDLEARMKTVDWQKDYFNKGLVATADPAKNNSILEKVNGVFGDMLILMTSHDPEAVKAHDQLAFKYFVDTPAERIITNMPALKERYEVKVRVNMNQLSAEEFSPRELYNLMNSRAVKGAEQVNAPAQWFRADLSHREKNGYTPIKAVPGSYKLNLEDSLDKIGLDNGINSDQKKEIVKLLEQGEKTAVTLSGNGAWMERVIVVDPAKNGIAIDLEESQKRGLYQPDPPELREHLEKYKDVHAENKEGIVRKMDKDTGRTGPDESLIYVHRPGRS